MICTKCGAPVPPGMSACPYCGAAQKSAPSVSSFNEEATDFAEVETRRPVSEEEATDFAEPLPRQRQMPDSDETEYAPVQEMPVREAPAHKAAHGQKKNQKAQAAKKAAKKKTGGTTGRQWPLRIVLLVILAVLVVLLFLQR